MKQSVNKDLIHTHTIKYALATGALSMALLGSPVTMSAQTQQTKQDLAKNISKTPQDTIKTRFVQSFSPIINTIKDVNDLPLKVRFKDRNLVENHHFPEYVDIQPKTIDKNFKNTLTLTLGDKMYKIVPYKGIKISKMHIVDSHNDLNAPKVVLTLELVGLFPRDIDISSKEFAEYIYKLNQMPVGQKSTIRGIHVEVLASNKPIKAPKPTKNVADSNAIQTGPILANHTTD